MRRFDISQLTASHWLLLRLAGVAPDDLICQCRRWLGQARVLDLGRAVTYAVRSQRIRLIDPDINLLAELLATDGADTSALSMVDVADNDPLPMHGFAPTRAWAGRGSAVAADTTPDSLLTDAAPEDDIDRAALRAVEALPSVRAVWRAWRYPGDGAPWPPPRRVWVFETDSAKHLAAITAWVQDVLERAGETYPQVEVYPARATLPSYQRLARGYGALMWAREPDPGVRVAGVFDEIDGHGPRMSQGHPLLTDPECGRVLTYLCQGELVASAAPMDDVIDSAQRGAVPMSLLTDGVWVWCDASTYYLEKYRLAPDEQLLRHVRARDYRMPLVDGAALYRAMAALQAPSADRHMWMIRR